MKNFILLPAFGCDERLYAPQRAALESMMDVSVIVPAANRYTAMVDEVLSKAPEQFIALGTSMGGRLALETTLAAPARVLGLVIIGAGAGPTVDPSLGLRRSERIRGGDKQQVLIEMGNIIAHMPGPRGPETREAFITMGQEMDPMTLARQSDALAHREDRWSALASITCPVLCLWGIHDQFSPTADGKRIAAAVQNGVYRELPECGHFPTLEYPEESNAILLEWFESVA